MFIRVTSCVLVAAGRRIGRIRIWVPLDLFNNHSRSGSIIILSARFSRTLIGLLGRVCGPDRATVIQFHGSASDVGNTTVSKAVAFGNDTTIAENGGGPVAAFNEPSNAVRLLVTDNTFGNADGRWNRD